MKLVIFGLTVSSSWGNGHATLWRGLCRALAAQGHHVVFFERDAPYYAQHRDLTELPGGELILYRELKDVHSMVRRHLSDADASMVTSYCPDGVAAAELMSGSPGLHVFYDMDTPVTLAQIREGQTTSYIGREGLRAFDLVLSYTGGAALDELRTRLGARAVDTLYGSVDPDRYRPVPSVAAFRADLSYLGTYAADRQAAVNELLLKPAQVAPGRRFSIAGAQYPADFPWGENVFFVRHLEPEQHPAFFCSSRLTLNVTRRAMAEMGYCPSGRLFEAAASGVAIVTDWWEGLDQFFEPGKELIPVARGEDVLRALEMSDQELQSIAHAARDRALREHTASHRASQLLAALERARAPQPENLQIC